MNHYETAFAAWMRSRQIAYLAVDDAKRSRHPEPEGAVKNFDFLVQVSPGISWLVDVKGRVYGGRGGRRWECWTTAADVQAADAWKRRFGPNCRPAFVFAYHLTAEPPTCVGNRDTLFAWSDRRYLLRAVPVDEYAAAMKPRSPRWGTVDLGSADYARLARAPADLFLGGLIELLAPPRTIPDPTGPEYTS